MLKYGWERVAQTMELAGVRCLSVAECIDSLPEVAPTSRRRPYMIRIQESKLTKKEEQALTVKLQELDELAAQVPAAARAKLDRTVVLLREVLPDTTQRSHAIEDLDHRRKFRRLRAYRTLSRCGVGSELAAHLTERYRRTGDQEALHLIARDPDAVNSVDAGWLLQELVDEYWRSRVIEGVLFRHPDAAEGYGEQYPFEFVYAVGRAEVKRFANKILEMAQRELDDHDFVGIAAWSLGQIRNQAALDELRHALKSAGRLPE